MLSTRYSVDFESVGLNLNRDGHDSVARHGDRIPTDLAEPLVATLTLGTQRRFLMRPKRDGRSLDFAPASTSWSWAARRNGRGSTRFPRSQPPVPG